MEILVTSFSLVTTEPCQSPWALTQTDDLWPLIRLIIPPIKLIRPLIRLIIPPIKLFRPLLRLIRPLSILIRPLIRLMRP